MKNDFWVMYDENATPSNENFQLHVHDDYEIYLFLEGDTKYIVEENVYTLEPGDMIIVRKNLMHRAYHNSPTRYRRIVLNVRPVFFEMNRCQEYEKEFINPPENASHKIDAKTVRGSGLYDAFMRIKKYLEHGGDTPVLRAAVVELLYLINNIKSYSKADETGGQIGEVIKYINNNFTSDITLDELEERFFISKYHLCHIFSKATGLTVHKYIVSKRMAYAGELIANGKSLTEAASLAGFNNYSSFYRAYIKEYGVSPREKRST